MTLKLTERDKKLLVFLAIFLIIVGIGAGVIYPLFTWSKSLDEELSTQKQLQGFPCHHHGNGQKGNGAGNRANTQRILQHDGQ